jgi:hypothetical protein
MHVAIFQQSAHVGGVGEEVVGRQRGRGRAVELGQDGDRLRFDRLARLGFAEQSFAEAGVFGGFELGPAAAGAQQAQQRPRHGKRPPAPRRLLASTPPLPLLDPGICLPMAVDSCRYRTGLLITKLRHVRGLPPASADWLANWLPRPTDSLFTSVRRRRRWTLAATGDGLAFWPSITAPRHKAERWRASFPDLLSSAARESIDRPLDLRADGDLAVGQRRLQSQYVRWLGRHTTK